MKDVLGYVRLLINEADDGAFLRVVNVPARGIGKGTVEKVMERAANDGATLLETARRIVEEGEGRAAKTLRNFLMIMEDLYQFRRCNGLSSLTLILVTSSGSILFIQQFDTIIVQVFQSGDVILGFISHHE